MYKYILFDFDGTVFNTGEGITKSVRYALNKHGIDAPLEELNCFIGPPLLDMFMSHCGFDRETAEQAVHDFRERYVPIGAYESEPYPGIHELLDKIRARGMHTGIATSKPEALARMLLERAGLFESFEVICGSTPGVADDAKWQVVRRAMDALAAVEAETVLIGDTKFDVEGAKLCGIDCIGVSYGFAADGELEAAGATAIAADMDELSDILLLPNSK